MTAFAAARAAGGRCLLRIEDIDAGRCRPAFEAGVYEDLAWLGLSWERPVRRQSEHLADYRAALERLRAAGLLYRCFRTRADILAEIGQAPHGDAPVFLGAPLDPATESQLLDEGAPFAWRLSLAAARAALGGFEGLAFVDEERGRFRARPELAGDVVLSRKDGAVAYHLAVVVDDAAQQITCVVRGEDLLAACHVQRLLQALLGLPTPRYRHHRLIADADGKRLAKRTGAQTLAALRAAGVTPTQILQRLGFG